MTNRAILVKIYPTMRSASLLFALITLSSCDRAPKSSATPLVQRAYVWQREWTPQVSAAVNRAAPKLDGVVVLAAQVTLKSGKATVFRPALDWPTLAAAKKPIGLAMRVDPMNVGPETTALVIETARDLLSSAASHGVTCAEFQMDFDAPQKKLADYRAWLRKLRQAIKPTRCVITTLPSWLDEPEFPKLLSEVDAYVLQVHSVTTREANERVALCDPARALKWVAKAGALGKPFVVSLPTYSALVGYDAEGKSLGMALDGVQPSWPRGTRVREFFSDAEEMLAIANGWKRQHPSSMTGLIWYRLPVDSDQRNWRWPTFAAVLEGRALRHQLEVITSGENPIDLSIANQGEADEAMKQSITARWDGPAPIASDALPGWELRLDEHSAVFSPASSPTPRLPPGARRGIGWLRFDQPAPLHVEITP